MSTLSLYRAVQHVAAALVEELGSDRIEELIDVELQTIVKANGRRPWGGPTCTWYQLDGADIEMATREDGTCPMNVGDWLVRSTIRVWE
jgi:hypothetical protein